MIDHVAIIGAGSGGKAAAVDLALQGKKVRLFDFPEFKNNLRGLFESKTLISSGAVEGKATLEMVSSDLSAVLTGVDMAMICTQALTHDRVAHELAPLIKPSQLVVLNPGSTGGALHFAKVFHDFGLTQFPCLVETSTLTYGCRAKGSAVEIAVKAKRVLYGTLPGKVIGTVGPELEALYPAFRPAASVLEAGLNNANPIIHPPIVLLNTALIENEGSKRYFYRDGISSTVAKLIRKLDEERMALLKALDYPAQPDPVTCVAQGYAASSDYYECYKTGPGFAKFRFPDTLDNRYLHEDIGMGLVMLCSLGQLLKVPTPICETIVKVGEALTGIDYMSTGKRTVATLGIDKLDKRGLKTYLETGTFI
jgi:opine dehydrogenase